MKTITKILLIGITALTVSCKAKQQVTPVPVRAETRVTERLVEIQLPADSAWLTAWLDCDSTNQVILRGMSERKSPGVFSDLKFQNGVLNYKSQTKPEPQQVAVRDSIVYKEIPVTVEVPVIEYRQTKTQNFLSRVGGLTLLFFGLRFAWKFLKSKFIIK